MRVWRLKLVAVLAALGGCGLIYTAPDVEDGRPLGEAYGTAYDVDVVPLTYASAAAANLSPYVPARLPLAFQDEVVERAVADAGAPSRLPRLPAPAAPQAALADAVNLRLPAPAQLEPYRVGVGDVLLLAVSDQTTLEGLPALISARAKREGYVVQDDGAISIPEIGRVRVAGLTLRQAEAEIAEDLLAANVDPEFSLEVAEFNSQQVAVGGEVAAPRIVPITPQPLYLHKAVELAGGIASDDPRATVIQLFRDGQIYQMSLDRFVNDSQARRIVLRDADTVFVGNASRRAEAEQLIDGRLQLENIRLQRESMAEQRLANQRNLFRERLELDAVERHFVFVTGEVPNPRLVALPFERTMSLNEIVFSEERGGLRIETSDYGEIYVLRAETDPRAAGGLTAYHLDAENAVNLAVASRFEMRPDDVVFVAEQPVTSWNRALSQILPQVSGVLSLPIRAANAVTGAGG